MKRCLCSTALAILLFGCAAEEKSSPPPPAKAAVPAGHDVTGAYFPIDALPDDFAELDHLLLATIDENAAPAPLNGFLRPKAPDAKDYPLVRPSLEERRLTFETAPVAGVRYAFDGRFEMLANFPENPPAYETVVLSGTLRRIDGGTTVASTPVRFRYEAGG